MVVAETGRPHLPFETTLQRVTTFRAKTCAWNTSSRPVCRPVARAKSIASYWNVRVGQRAVQNIVWSYPDPIAECPKIRGFLSFFNEHVDPYVDGDLQMRPTTPWS